MSPDSSWTPDDAGAQKANPARVYDALLGGTHHFSVDREVARALEAIEPKARAVARANRDFLGRVVRYLAAEAGIRQFLDVGSGIPTEGNVHEIAQGIAPDSRIVYVDIDPVAVAHSKAILADNPNATTVPGDLREPQRVLDHPDVRGTLDFSRPIALLLMSVLVFLTDDERPGDVARTLVQALPSGSYLALSHGTTEDRPDIAAAVETLYSRSVSAPVVPRSRAAILRFFDGLELVEPGLVYVTEWRPDPSDKPVEHPEDLYLFGGVARVR